MCSIKSGRNIHVLSFHLIQPSFGYTRVATHVENKGKLGNLTLVREKLGKLVNVREIVACLRCAVAVALVIK